MNLKTKVNNLLSDSLRMYESYPNNEKLKTELINMTNRLNEPLRVAVIGVMKAGKSTLLNAIMKEKILITGIVETTYITSWFKFGNKPSLTIVFNDMHKITASIDDLAKWTSREMHSINPEMDNVKYVEIYYPNEVLKKLEIIDTPGLASTYKKDSQNTLDFLGMSQEDNAELISASKTTMIEASKADAVIYAFTRGAQSSDQDILEAFQNGAVANTTPINAVGVLTKADANWQLTDDISPIEKTESVAQSLMSVNALRRLIYTVKPVCSILAEGAAGLTEENWETLENLSKLDEYVFLSLIGDSKTFAHTSVEDFEELMEMHFSDEQKKYICESEKRARVYNSISQYGVNVVVNALRNKMGRAQVTELLYKESGVDDVYDLIHSHFANHAYILKSNFIFQRLNAVTSDIMKDIENDNQIYRICEFIREEITNIIDSEQVFKEINILQNYFNGQLVLKNEIEKEMLLQITGELGTSCESKLGVGEPLSINDLLDITKKKMDYWNERENDVPITRQYKQAAQVLSRSYGILLYHLESLTYF